MSPDPLAQLAERGQSVWLDFIDRSLVTSDRLQTLIDQRHVSGMTSNPTIFEKAIAEGDDYDEQLRQLVGAGMSGPDELFVELASADIQRAADILRPIYDRTEGGDGFVSIEVAPSLAHDTEGTVAAAHYLWDKIERPNLMVKIPATPEGIPAIQRCIADGLNINVTLIFALEAYQAVAEAFVRGLEERAAAGRPVGSSQSVASFFVSRVDTAVDKLLEEKLARKPGDPELEALLGTAAIANAVLAYERFEQIFRGERFAGLRAAGAHVQRPLWASTSAKNPRYRDVVYAEALIGPDTVDTMPPATIDAFGDHGRVEGDTVRADYPGAHRVMERLAAVGIDMAQVTEDLLRAGVASFADSYNQLIQSIALKADALHGGVASRMRMSLGGHGTAVSREVAEHGADTVRRLWARDPDLWKPGDAEHAQLIRERLGWLDVVATMEAEAPALAALAAQVRDQGIRDVVLLGMGGSSLGPEVFRTALGSAPGFPTLHVLDTTDPVAIDSLTRSISPERTLFIVSSKSGGTVETLSHLEHFWATLEAAGTPDVGSHFIAVTDPGTSLATTARERGFRRVFENPPDIGGRYSVLSYFGLVPAALSGIGVEALLARATTMLGQCSTRSHPSVNVGLGLGTAFGVLQRAGVDKVTILAPPSIEAFSLWAEQLIAESTGKEGTGLIPVGAEPIGAPDVYGDDRLFVALHLGAQPDFDRAVDALREAGRPVIDLQLEDGLDLAGEFVRWEFATAVAGAMLHIDAFDQPNVQESKDNTNRLLRIVEEGGSLPAPPPTAEADRAGVVEGLLEELRPGDYLAIMAYVTPDEANQAALQELRTRLRDHTRAATTLGFGPRFLHSTGQLHKGGPNTGVFLQITTDDALDVPIPGRRYSFAVLKRAQATGDLESLRSHGRRADHLHIAGGLPEALRRLATAYTPATAGR